MKITIQIDLGKREEALKIATDIEQYIRQILAFYYIEEKGVEIQKYRPIKVIGLEV